MDEPVEIIFKEKQKFAPWVHLVVLSAMIFSISIIYITFKEESAKGNSLDKEDFIPLIISIGLPIVIEILFTFLKMETEVRNDGIYVRLFPVHIHFRKFSPEDISEAFARKYAPVSEYGGWGIKGSRNNRAYNTRGNEGVQLVFNGGKRLLIGSQKIQELEKAIKSIMR
jgi:hypothetical protein